MLRSLSSEAFARLLADAAAALGDLLRRALALHHAVEEALDDAEASAAADAAGPGGATAGDAAAATAASSGRGPAAPIDATSAARARAVSASVVASAASVCQRSVARLLRVRGPVHSDASRRLDEAARAWAVAAAFADAAQASVTTATGASAPPAGDNPVRAEVARQAAARLRAASDGWAEQVDRALDADTWSASPVAPFVQSLVTPGLALAEPSAVLLVPPLTAPTPLPAPAACPPGWGFRVCASLQVLAKVGDAAVGVAAVCHASAPDSARVAGRLLTRFGARTAALVLRAEAVEAGAVRRITTRHLAVALRSLQAASALARLWERRLAACMPPSEAFSALTSLRGAADDLAEHAEAARAKVAAVVQTLVDEAGQGLARQSWEGMEMAEPAAGAQLALPAQDSLVPPLLPLAKGLRALGRILAGLLPPEPLEEVCGRIAVMLSAQLPLHASSIDADSLTAAQRRGAAAHVGSVVIGLSALPGCGRGAAGGGEGAETAGQVAVLSLVRWMERHFGTEGRLAAAAVRFAVDG